MAWNEYGMKNKQSSFTLIELLVVIAIVGLLAAIVLVGLGVVRGKARDAKRLVEINQIVIALELYHIDNNRYPGPTSSYGEAEGTCGGWDTSSLDNDGDGKPFIEPLVDEGIVQQVPLDPINTGSCGSGFAYRYYRYGAGGYGCDSSKGAFYVLGINDIEGSKRPYSDSPGWNCPARNWQNEFDWVTGEFEG